MDQPKEPSDREPSNYELAVNFSMLIPSNCSATDRAMRLVEMCRQHFHPQGEPVQPVAHAHIYAAVTPTHKEARVVFWHAEWPQNQPLGATIPLYASPPRSVADSLAVTVDKEGVRFGKNVWFAHEKICGRMAGVIASEYYKWVDAMLAAAPLPPPPEEPSASEARSDL